MAGVGRMVKESIVSELSQALAERSNLFIAKIGRLPAAEANTFRSKLNTSQARLIMVKRRLGQRALSGLNVAGADQLLEGSVGLILPGEDVLPTAKILVEFVKGHEEQMAVRGAVIEGQLLDPARVKELAELPPKPILLAQVLATIESPMADVIFTIERLIGDLAWIAEQAAEKRPAQPAAAPTTEAGTPPAGEVAEGSPDTEGGRTQPDEQQYPKPEGGAPA